MTAHLRVPEARMVRCPPSKAYEPGQVGAVIRFVALAPAYLILVPAALAAFAAVAAAEFTIHAVRKLAA